MDNLHPPQRPVRIYQRIQARIIAFPNHHSGAEALLGKYGSDGFEWTEVGGHEDHASPGSEEPLEFYVESWRKRYPSERVSPSTAK